MDQPQALAHALELGQQRLHPVRRLVRRHRRLALIQLLSPLIWVWGESASAQYRRSSAIQSPEMVLTLTHSLLVSGAPSRLTGVKTGL